MKQKTRFFFGLVLVVILLMGVNPVWADEPPVEPETPTDTPTVVALEEPTATPVPEPTATPVPEPTSTPVPEPTSTPSPTATLTPEPTSTPSPTATLTPIWPTDTPTRVPTISPTASCVDKLEPNDEPGTGPTLIINQAISDLTLYPFAEIDYFLLWSKAGKYYQVTTNTSEGVDTRVQVFDPSGALVADNDDYRTGSPASQASYQAYMDGWYIVSVDSRVPANWDCRRYSIIAVDVSAPTSTPTRTPSPPGPAATSTPQPTAIPGEVMFDDYEPNFDFETAANIGVGQTLSLNFNPWPAGSGEVDNDYFRLYVKVGEQLRIETTSLAQGLDTNLILYRDNGEIIAGNDDCIPGQLASCVEWEPNYTGVAYVLTGPVGTIPEGVAAGSRTYSLVVKDLAGQPATPVSGQGGPGGTPTPWGTPSLGLPWKVTPLAPSSAPGSTTVPGTPPSPFATPTSAVQVRQVSMEPPTPTPLSVQLVTIGLTVYYDENNNKAPDINEGVAGISVRVLDAIDNRFLGQAFTGHQGHTVLTVTAVDEVRLSVPYLGYSQKIEPPGETVSIRLAPLRLPSLIP